MSPGIPRSRPRSGGARERGQAAVVGVILMFGLLIALLALIQLGAVPGWNEAIEFNHNERTQGDMQSVHGEIHRTAVTGQSRTDTVELGVRYPSRPFLFNPPDPTGRLATTDPGEFEIQNIEIEGVDNYWEDDGGRIQGLTRELVYEPHYNEYRTPPTTVYENGILYNEFEQPIPLSREGFLDGERLSLVTLAGEFERMGTRPTSVPLKPESAPTQPVSVRSADGDPITVTVPTRLPESEWESVLSNEFQRNGGHVLGDEDGVDVSDGNLTVTLDPDIEYDLRLARVSVGEQSSPMGPHYITRVSGGETSLGPNQGERLAFEVRDRFNNPVSGVDVEFDATDGRLSRTSVQTGSDGQATVRYTAPPEAGMQTVTATADIDEETTGENHRAHVPVSVVDESTEDGFVGSNPGQGSGKVQLVDSPRNGTGVDITFRNEADVELTLTQIRAAFYYPSDEANPPTAGTYSYHSFETQFDIPGDFVSIEGPTLTASGEPGNEDVISLRDLRNNPGGDFMVVHTVWVDSFGDAHTYSYFVGISR